MEKELKQAVQRNVKTGMIESKYENEPITFGQALVTYHYIQNQPIRTEFPENQLSPARPATAAGRANKMSPAKQLLGQMESTRSEKSPGHAKTVQWDLVEKQFRNTFARQSVRTNEFGNVSEALQLQRYEPLSREELAALKWTNLPAREPYAKRYPRGHCRSITPPTQWQTEQRDQFRTFLDSPDKDGPGKYAEPVFSNQNFLVGDGQNMDLVDVEDQENQAPLNTTERKEGKTVKIAQDQQSETTRRTVPKKVLTPAQKKQEKEMKKRRSEFNNTTRWLADSAFTTYFGKPAFHAYGKGNVNPSVGGVNYGHNLLTHNINAECGDHPPLYQQVYDAALTAGVKKTRGMRVPEIPLTKAVKILTDAELEEIQARKPTMPAQRRAMGKNQGGSIKIAKPEMTLTGFKHSAATMSRKQKLDMKAVQSGQFVDVMSSSRRSRSKHSHVSYQDLQNPSSEDRSQSARREGFQVIDPAELPPMNEELEVDSDLENEAGVLSPANAAGQQEHNPAEAASALPSGCDPVLLNPRNYSFVPSQWTTMIRPAGRFTIKSENIKRVIIGVDE